MLTVLKNDWRRILVNKTYIFVALFLTICSVVAAVLLTNKVQTKINVAVVTTKKQIALSDSPAFAVTKVKKVPLKSQLLSNRYDAIVIEKSGTYEIQTIKGKDVKKIVAAGLAMGAKFRLPEGGRRQIGTNIIGYMMMFLLMQGLTYAKIFGEDKEKHIMERVAVAPGAFLHYIFGHFLFFFLLIFVPSYLVICVTKFIGVNVGFSLLQYALLLSLFTLFACSFCLFMYAMFQKEDSANMIGSALIVFASALSGSFTAMTANHSWIDRVIHILPQNDFLEFINAWEKGTLTWRSEGKLLYVIIFGVVLLLIAMARTKKDYVCR